MSNIDRREEVVKKISEVIRAYQIPSMYQKLIMELSNQIWDQAVVPLISDEEFRLRAVGAVLEIAEELVHTGTLVTSDSYDITRKVRTALDETEKENNESNAG